MEDTKATRVFTACNNFAAVFIVWLVCFGPGLEYIGEAGTAKGDYIRREVILGCAVVYFLRVLATMFVFLKRKMGAGEAVVIAVWLYIINIFFALGGASNKSAFGAAGLTGIVLYVFGSYLNTASEYGRYRWRKKPENAGKLYTRGLFRYTRHINYFGDMVLFTGFSLVTGRIITLVIPALMALGFIFVNIPVLDRHLENKYGDDFIAYKKRTKAFVPFVY
jgi:protein-S-isoprenylcysteine O-methyltransferase Ste14